MPCCVVVNPYITGREKSLSFEQSSSQYLSMSNADWGAYDRSHIAIAGSFYPDALATGTHVLFSRMGVGDELLVRVTDAGALYINTYTASTNGVFISSDGLFTNNTWGAFLIVYDQSEPDSADRIKVWFNGSAVTPASYTSPAANISTVANETYIGRQQGVGDYTDGLLYQMTFISGSTPAPEDVFNGTAGKLKDLSGLTGVYSRLDAATPTHDSAHAGTWVNNNGVGSVGESP